MAGCGVIYQLTGTRHAEQLVVSMYSLRQLYDGPVQLLVGDDDAWRVGRYLSAEPRMRPLVVTRFDASCGKIKHGGYLDKTRVHLLSMFDSSVFFDADTLIVGHFRELWPSDDEIVLTQFSDWVTTGKRMRGRTDKWRPIAEEYVERSQRTAQPAINTGVFAFTKHTSYMEHWRRLTQRAYDYSQETGHRLTFIADEIAAQLVYAAHWNRVLDCRFNASVVYESGRDGVRVWHGHGGKFLRRESGRSIWCPWHQRARQEGFADLNKWGREL